LINGIVAKSPENFVYHRWDKEEEKVVGRCSRLSVRKTFDLAVDLGLLDRKSGALTESGKAAANPVQFATVMRRRVRGYLQQEGCPVGEIERTASAMLAKRRIVLPTAEELYDAVCASKRLGITAPRFAAMLRLLAASGGLASSRRQIFLPS
jgi:hypothetical protein